MTTSPRALSMAQVTTLLGRVALFLGTYTRGWTDAQFAAAARNARAMGVDTLIYKVADGGQAWYAPERVTSIRKAMLAEGCGALPYQYLYGMRFGDAQIGAEADMAKRTLAAADGLVCLDMEVEWNGQVAAATRLATLLADAGGHIFPSTWADPVQQDWLGVIAALNPIAAAWMPQQYNNWLDAQQGQLAPMGAAGAAIIPTFDLSGEFGANDPLGHAHTALARGQTSISLWEYQFAQQNPNLARAIASVMGTPLTSAAPVKLPAPPSTTKPTSPATPVAGASAPRRRSVVVRSGDTLSAIAGRVGLPNWYADLFLPNRAVIDAAARAHGHASSNGGALIFPGTTLAYVR